MNINESVPLLFYALKCTNAECSISKDDGLIFVPISQFDYLFNEHERLQCPKCGSELSLLVKQNEEEQNDTSNDH